MSRATGIYSRDYHLRTRRDDYDYEDEDDDDSAREELSVCSPCPPRRLTSMSLTFLPPFVVMRPSSLNPVSEPDAGEPIVLGASKLQGWGERHRHVRVGATFKAQPVS